MRKKGKQKMKKNAEKRKNKQRLAPRAWPVRRAQKHRGGAPGIYPTNVMGRSTQAHSIGPVNLGPLALKRKLIWAH